MNFYAVHRLGEGAGKLDLHTTDDGGGVQRLVLESVVEMYYRGRVEEAEGLVYDTVAERVDRRITDMAERVV